MSWQENLAAKAVVPMLLRVAVRILAVAGAGAIAALAGAFPEFAELLLPRLCGS